MVVRGGVLEAPIHHGWLLTEMIETTETNTVYIHHWGEERQRLSLSPFSCGVEFNSNIIQLFSAGHETDN
jgi:hypothetical protein